MTQSDIKINKSHSVAVAPHTVKHIGKRMYSPLARIEKPKEVPVDYTRSFVIGICGGSSSGKTSVAKVIKDSIPSAVILNLIHFYKPIRGNLRRRSRADSLYEDGKDEEQIKSEIRETYKASDFDSPEAIDWQLLNKGVSTLKNG